MTESILDSVKKVLNIPKTQTAFDQDIMMHTNSALAIMTQLGVGPPEGFMILNSDQTWDEFIGTDPVLNLVKTCVYMRVRLIFDPPQTSFGIAAMERQITEHEARINIHREEVTHPWPLPLTTSSLES